MMSQDSTGMPVDDGCYNCGGTWSETNPGQPWSAGKEKWTAQSVILFFSVCVCVGVTFSVAVTEEVLVMCSLVQWGGHVGPMRGNKKR